jgi:hypothetical protein
VPEPAHRDRGEWPSFPFFLGCGRSGTTLVRLMFRANSRLAMVPEHHFPPAPPPRWTTPDGALNVARAAKRIEVARWFPRFGIEPERFRAAIAATPPETYADLVRTLYGLYAAREGKPFYGNKTPGHVRYIPELAAQFPEGRFIHIVRDGRDVALSYLDQTFGPSDVPSAARFWQDRVTQGREGGARIGSDRYREIRYEDLLADPENELRAICAFLGLPFEEGMLRFHELDQARFKRDPHGYLSKPLTPGLRDWRTQMSRADQLLFERIAGSTLDDFGYPRETEDPSAVERARAELRRSGSEMGERLKAMRRRSTVVLRRVRRA